VPLRLHREDASILDGLLRCVCQNAPHETVGGLLNLQTFRACLTIYALSRADATRAFPGAGPDLQTRELRYLSEPGAAPPDSRARER